MRYLIVTGVVAAIIVVYTVIFAIFDLSNSPQWLNYIQSLYHFGVIAALAGFVLNQLEVKEKNMIDYVAEINQQQELGFIDIEKTFMQYYPELLPLYKEINNPHHPIQKLPVPKNIDQVKRRAYETNICNIIIQRIENTYSAVVHLGELGNFDRARSQEFAEWVSTWRQWFLSPTLRNVWNFNKARLFSKQTQQFIDSAIIGGKSYVISN